MDRRCACVDMLTAGIIHMQKYVITDTEAGVDTGMINPIMWCPPTCQVLDDCCHVDGCTHADAVFVRASAQVPHHSPHRKDDTCPGWTGQLGGLLLSPSGWHPALDTRVQHFMRLHRSTVLGIIQRNQDIVSVKRLNSLQTDTWTNLDK